MKKVLVTLPDELLRRADRAARAAGLNRSAFLEAALEGYLRGGNGRRPLDDPRVRKAWEKIRDGKFNWAGHVDIVREIRRMREAR